MYHIFEKFRIIKISPKTDIGPVFKNILKALFFLSGSNYATKTISFMTMDMFRLS
jgi:hypothetical protein